MVKIIISGHGQLSTGILSAFEMIFGADPAVIAIPFLKGEGLPQVQEKFQAEIDALAEGEEVLFLVDVFGGTPYNAAAQVIYPLKNADILTGVNLPLVLEAASRKDGENLAEIIPALKNVGYESFKVFTEEIKKTQIDSEEDLL